MTLSREDVRKRQYRDRAKPSDAGEPIPLAELCVIVGCLRLRVGSNLCRVHDEQSNP